MAPTTLPQEFITRLQERLGTEAPLFFETLDGPTPVSVRLNARKPSTKWAVNPAVPWCSQGRYLEQRPAFVEDPAIHAGQYYVQEASSMFLDWAVQQLPPAKRMLDLCGAPGGKSTLLASRLPEDGVLLANEVIGKRAAILAENLLKWGATNAWVTQSDPSRLGKLGPVFDLVVVDAPCSGEGLFRKDLEARKEWSSAGVSHCASRQKRILAEAAELVMPGGILIYSTCTYNSEENQQNVSWLLEQGDWEGLALNPDPNWGVETIAIGEAEGYALMPHRLQGEGFFLTALRKTSATTTRDLRWKKKQIGAWKPFQLEKIGPLKEHLIDPGRYSWWIDDQSEVIGIPAGQEAFANHVAHTLPVQQWGLHLGRVSPKEFIPTHSLALSGELSNETPALDLDRKSALRYLQREYFETDLPAKRGWYLIRFEGLELGWAKVVPGRLNNYYPKAFRIRKRLDL